jgi:general secretion pathway protein L
MPGYVIGLDLGRAVVKAAVLRGTLRGYEIVDFLSVETQGDGDDAVFAAAEAVLDAAPPGPATVIAAMPAARVSTWGVELPFSDKKRIEATLPFEVENFVPFDLETVILDWQVLEPGPPSRLFTAMAPRDRVRALLDALRGREIDPRSLTLDAAALANLAAGGGGAARDETPVIIDVGATRTLLCVAPGGLPRWVRSLTAGCAGWGDDIASDRAVASWVARVRSSLLAAQDGGAAPDRVLLCGGGAQREGLGQLLAEALGIPADPLQQPPPPVRPEDAPRGGPEHALAYAIARTAFEPRPRAPVDFRKGEFTFRADSRRYGRLVGASVAAAVLLFSGFVGQRVFRAAKLGEQADSALTQLVSSVQTAFPEVPATALGSERAAIAVMQEKVSAVEARVAALKGPESTPLDALKQMSELVPTDVTVDVDEFTVDSEVVRIRGETDSFQSVDRIEAAVQAGAGWQGAEKSDVNKTPQGKMRFVLTVPRVPQQTEVGG